MAKKLNFRSALSLVIGSQIGSGVFLLPSSLAALGSISLLSWCISGMGAVLIALVFARLSFFTEKGGGPHVYIEKAFGPKWAFFAAWSYWLISWMSSIAVIIAAIGYLSPLLPLSTPFWILVFEMAIITAVTLLNLRGALLAGAFEICLTILKCIPLLLIPLVSFFFFEPSHFDFRSTGSSFTILNGATLLTFWGFIGIEAATTLSSLIENPKKTIPRAVVIGTSIVALLYFLNSFAIMGVVPPEELSLSQAPYAAAAEKLFGSGWERAIALIGFIACLGTLNAWVLTSGQIALEAAKQGLFPSFFQKENRAQAPYFSLLIALVLTLLLLFLTLTPNILSQLNWVIDVSVSAFLFLYLACCLALAKLVSKEDRKGKILAGISALFCLWVLVFCPWQNLALSLFFALSGWPFYEPVRKKIHQFFHGTFSLKKAANSQERGNL